MKKVLITFISLLLLASTEVKAQPGPVKKVANAVFTITTFKSDGSILANDHGVFIDGEGTGITSFSPFIGATSAKIHDARGKELEVDYIIGANELYNVAKIKVKGLTSSAPLAADIKAGTKAWLVPYAVNTPACQEVKVDKVEKFNSTFNYYIMNSNAPENAISCPFVTADGKVLGLLVHSNTDSDVHAIDARFTNSLKVNGISSLDPALKQTEIRTKLPDTEDDAMFTLIMAKNKGNENNVVKYIEEYISKFPTSSEGYKEQAEYLMLKNKYAEADKILQTGIQKSSKKDEAHYNYSSMIYKTAIYSPEKYQLWTLDKAYEEAETAYKIKALPVYQHLMAQIIFSQQKYQKAYESFIALTKSDMRSGELFYEAAQSKRMLNAPKNEIFALLDSAVNVYTRPYTVQNAQMVAPYIYARGKALDEMGKYREALKDYNEYDTLMLFRANHEFYYTRYKCEMQIRQWQQALQDISHAIILNPNEPTYFAELASLDIRVHREEEAIKSARRCIELAPEYADGYLLLGLALCQTNNTTEGITNLEKAKQLGDKRADGYIKKFK